MLMGWSVKKRRSRRNKYIYLHSIFIRTARPYLLVFRFGAFMYFLAGLGRNQMCRVHVALPKRPVSHKSDNLQYITLGHWVDGTILLPSNGPIFQQFLQNSNYVYHFTFNHNFKKVKSNSLSSLWNVLRPSH